MKLKLLFVTEPIIKKLNFVKIKYKSRVSLELGF